MTLMLAGAAALTVSAQQQAKTFPSAAVKTEGPAKAPLFKPAAAPANIDDKANGTLMYATTLASSSKTKYWLSFYSNSYYNTLNQITDLSAETDEVGTKTGRGVFCSAYIGDNKVFALTGHGVYNPGLSGYEFRKFEAFEILNATTGESLKKVRSFKTMYESSTDSTGTEVFYYGHYGKNDLPAFDDFAYDPSTETLYAVARYQEDAATNAVTHLYTIDVETGQYTKIQDIEDQVLSFTFDYDGNMYTVSPWWKSVTGGGYSLSGTNLSKYDENLQLVSGSVKHIADMELQEYVVMGSNGSLQFNYTTGDLWWICMQSSGYDKIGMLSESGQYTKTQSFYPGDQMIGLYIPYLTADERGAAAQVSNLQALPDEEGSSKATVKWTNPTTTWNKNELGDLKEVLVYRKKAGMGKALTSEEIYENSELVETIDATGQAGKEMTFLDESAPEGLNTYYVVPCRVKGEKGVPDSVRCVVGADVPGVVTDLVATAEGDGIKVSWKAPEVGENNGYVNQADLKYTLVRQPDGTKVADGISETSFTDNTLNERMKYSYDVYASNAKGVSKVATSNEVTAGLAAYPPVAFPATNATDAGQWTVVDANADYSKFEWNDYYKRMTLYLSSYGCDDWVISPSFRLEAGKTYKFTSTFNNFYGHVLCDITRTVGKGTTAEAQTNVLGTEKEYSSDVDYPGDVVYEDRFKATEDGTYNFGFHVANSQGYDLVMFAGVEIEEVVANDMKVASVVMPKDLVSSDVNTVAVNVVNNGSDKVNASAYTVSVVQIVNGEEKVVGTATETPALKSGEEATVAVDFVPGNEGSQQFAALVSLPGDQNTTNDKSEFVTVDVLPYGTTPWTGIVTDGQEEKFSYWPFSFSDATDGSQSIYTASDLDLAGKKSNTIERIGYEYDCTFDDAREVPNLKVYMMNVDKSSMAGDDDWVDPTTMTQVFDGTVTVKPGNGNLLSITLDTPFEYNPDKNLLICAVRNGGDNGSFNILWRSYNYDGFKHRSLRYSSYFSTKYAEKELPVLYVGFHKDATGIDNISGSSKAFSYENGKLVFGENTGIVRVFDISGKLVRTYNAAGNTAVSPSLPSGLYIVKSQAKDGTTSSMKLNINK